MEKVSEKCNLAEEGYAKMVRYIIDGIKAKLGLLEDEPAEIFDFRMLPEELEALVDYKMYFPGYPHEQKNIGARLFLMVLYLLKRICRRIDASYLLATQ